MKEDFVVLEFPFPHVLSIIQSISSEITPPGTLKYVKTNL